MRAIRGRTASGAPVELDAVPPVGARIVLEGPANRAAGGGASDLRDGAPAPLAKLALDAAAAIGLRLAAVDVLPAAAICPISS